MTVYVTVTFSPSGSNDQANLIGVYSTVAKGKAAMEKLAGKVTWHKEGKQWCFYEEGQRSPWGAVMAVGMNGKPTWDISL